MKYVAIACVNARGCIGLNGELLYSIHNDMANFRRLTIGNVVIMGRKTFESLPNIKPLSDRVNIIITSNKDYHVDKHGAIDVHVVTSLEDAVKLCEEKYSNLISYVIGGESIYVQAMRKNILTDIMLTCVNDDKHGDASFPPIDEESWMLRFETLYQHEGYDFKYEYYTKVNG